MKIAYPENLRFLDSHEYVKVDGDIATIGISAFAVDQLGDIVFVEVPETGATVTKGETFGTVESVKAVEDLYSPVSGTVVERNDAVIDSPEQLTEDPYESGWLMKVQLNDPSEAEDALSASEYRSRVEGS